MLASTAGVRRRPLRPSDLSCAAHSLPRADLFCWEKGFFDDQAAQAADMVAARISLVGGAPACVFLPGRGRLV